jgi:hypothetical protein
MTATIWMKYWQSSELQIKKNSCQTLGPASKRVLPDLSAINFLPDLLFFLEIF